MPGDPFGEAVTYQAGDGGTVTIASDGAILTIVSVDPADDWTTEIEVSAGREVEVDFRNGIRRIQFNAELEDGEVRIRVRDRIVDDQSGSADDGASNNSGPSSDGVDNSGPGNSDDDNSNSGTSVDDDSDDDSNSGTSNEDDSDDDDSDDDSNSGSSNEDDSDDDRSDDD